MPESLMSHIAHKALPQSIVHKLEDVYRTREYKRTKALDPHQYREALRKWFEKSTGEKLDLDNPQTFNQKMQWLKLYDSTEQKGRLADKYFVRSWIEEQLGPDYLVQLQGHWTDANQIDFTTLKTPYVLKASQGCATNIFVKDVSKLDISATRAQLDRWLHQDFAFANGGFELHYSLVEPSIIAEEYMDFSHEEGQLYDYRFFSSWGKVFTVWCNSNGENHRYARAIFTPEWEMLQVKATREIANPAPPKPVHYDEMMAIAQKLSANFAFVRVDLYEYRGHVKCGEMTFYPSMGTIHFEPASFNLWMGNQITLPTEKKPYRGIIL